MSGFLLVSGGGFEVESSGFVIEGGRLTTIEVGDVRTGLCGRRTGRWLCRGPPKTAVTGRRSEKKASGVSHERRQVGACQTAAVTRGVEQRKRRRRVIEDQRWPDSAKARDGETADGGRRTADGGRWTVDG